MISFWTEMELLEVRQQTYTWGLLHKALIVFLQFQITSLEFF